jgi:hypothetical protein
MLMTTPGDLPATVQRQFRLTTGEAIYGAVDLLSLAEQRNGD